MADFPELFRLLAVELQDDEAKQVLCVIGVSPHQVAALVVKKVLITGNQNAEGMMISPGECIEQLLIGLGRGGGLFLIV